MALERGFSVLAINFHTGSDRWLVERKKRADNYMALFIVVISVSAIASILPG
jgi:hypothetical protein